MNEQIFLIIRSLTTKEQLEPYLQYKDFGIRRYARERLRELEEDIFDLERI